MKLTPQVPAKTFAVSGSEIELFKSAIAEYRNFKTLVKVLGFGIRVS
jgi:hypothetical protein